MFETEIKPISIAVGGLFSGGHPRLCRVCVRFPDIGTPTATDFGFFRFSGERSIVAPEATDEELSLLPGLTIYL